MAKVTKDGVVHGKPCCAVWAVDCKEEEPQFQRGLNRDCIVTKACFIPMVAHVTWKGL